MSQQGTAYGITVPPTGMVQVLGGSQPERPRQCVREPERPTRSWLASREGFGKGQVTNLYKGVPAPQHWALRPLHRKQQQGRALPPACSPSRPSFDCSVELAAAAWAGAGVGKWQGEGGMDGEGAHMELLLPESGMMLSWREIGSSQRHRLLEPSNQYVKIQPRRGR